MSPHPCPSCGAANPAKAKFCGDCGARFAPAAAGGPTPAGSDTILKWFLAGTLVLALHAAAIILAVRGGTGGGGGGGSGDVTGGGPVGGPPAGAGASGTTDISNMTPREAADRLYDRVARASEAGDTAQVAFFAPMTVQAYGNVSPLDIDARLHIGLVQVEIREFAASLAQADTIVRESRTHLFGPLLRARVAQRRADQAAARTAWRAFLQNYDTELAKNLPEYQQHGTMLSQARTEAQGAAGSN